MNGSAITIVFFTATYVGHLSADGASITGAWIDRYGQPGSDPEDFRRATKATEWPLDVAAHTVRFVTVDTNVTLEVLDWGGTGRPLVMLSGLGNSAHRYDRFAPKLTASYHVLRDHTTWPGCLERSPIHRCELPVRPTRP